MALLDKWHEDIRAPSSGALRGSSRQAHCPADTLAMPLFQATAELHRVDPLQELDKVRACFWDSKPGLIGWVGRVVDRWFIADVSCPSFIT